MPGTSGPAASSRRFFGAPALARRFLARLRTHDDREHEMAINRIVLTLAFLGYLSWQFPQPALLTALAIYLAAGIGLCLHLLIDARSRHWRRIAGLVIDMSIAFAALYLGGPMTAGVYPLMLWVIFGNGFRFGINYLHIATAMALVAFAAAIAVTDYWKSQMPLAGGLLIGLVILPLYAGTLIQKLSQAKREAEDANQAKSYFLASVSHELRTPLNAVIGLGGQLEQSGLPREQRDMVATITSAGRSLLSMIDQLLQFSRIGAQSIAPERQSFDLVKLLDDIRRLMQHDAAAKGLTLGVHVSARTPLMIEASADSIRNVLVNLAGNAIKFTDRGSIVISVDATRLPDGNHCLRFEVADTGIGIAADAIDHIFESFRQADSTIMDRFGGTGLGLAICAELVNLMGGTIGVDSVAGEGSRFWFELQARATAQRQPVATATAILFSDDAELAARLRAAFGTAAHQLIVVDAPESVSRLADAANDIDDRAVFVDERFLARLPDGQALVDSIAGPANPPVLIRGDGETTADDAALHLAFASVLSASASFNEIRNALRICSARSCGTGDPADAQPATPARSLDVLVADDNRTNRQVLDMLLTRAGHRVTLVDDGDAALDVLDGGRFDVVLMDINMPSTNGIEVTKLYRVEALGKTRLPIVGITADASAETARRCLDAGMDACVTKPIEPHHLLELLDRLTRDNVVEASVPVDPLGVVTPLRRESRPALAEPLVRSTLDDLAALGGAEFIGTLLATYEADSTDMLRVLEQSAAIDDANEFRFAAHALSSTAANVGAGEVAKLCKRLQHIGNADFSRKKDDYVRRVAHELDRARAALADYVAAIDSRAPASSVSPLRQRR